MAGCNQQIALGSVLHTATGIHDENVISKLRDNTEVMGNDDNGVTHLLLNVVQCLNDLSLNGDAEAGGGLVGDQQVGLEDHGHTDEDSLTETGGELAGIALADLFPVVDTHQLQCVADSILALLLGGLLLMDTVCLAQLGADGHIGVERGVGVLEDQGDLLTADTGHLALALFQKVLSLEDDLAALNAAGLIHDLHDRTGGNALTGAGLTDNTQNLTLFQRKVHAFNGLDHSAVGHMEVGTEVLNFQQHIIILVFHV